MTEHLWGHFKTDKAKHALTSEEALWSTIKSCWDNTSRQVSDKLVEFVPARVRAVLKVKGGTYETPRYSEIHGNV